MLAIGIVLVVLALLISLFGAIWVGVPAGIVGILLIIAAVAGIGRRADRAQEPRA
jgi:hypothetical protein